MRVSQHYGLKRSQGSLEFVDVDTEDDRRLYVDPRAFLQIPSDWARLCVYLLQSFFTTVLDGIHGGDHDRAQGLLASLREPNETHLGQSVGRSRGHGMGDGSAVNVWDSFVKSEAARSGLLQDLEDTVLMVPGIGVDIISDITTNIVREPLISFTQDACDFYGIPAVDGVASGRLWDPDLKAWTQKLVRLPIVRESRLLLVPKSIVRRTPEYDPGEYYNDFVLTFLQEDAIRSRSPLVEVLKNGDLRVTKKSLRAFYGTGKGVSVGITREHPQILDQYRSAKARAPLPPPNHQEIADLTGTPPPDWDALLTAVTSVPPGTKHSHDYHVAIESLLNALFYPSLSFPHREFEIHEGRKRLDISYTNQATAGYFWWVHAKAGIPAATIVVECKNYSHSIANPEFDQISGRFSPNRGKIGLLCYRSYDDKGKTIRSCRDTAADDRGFILPLDDADLTQLVAERKAQGEGQQFDYQHLLAIHQKLT